jgi:two-component system, NtrC family, sensor histidine kinase PilS
MPLANGAAAAAAAPARGGGQQLSLSPASNPAHDHEHTIVDPLRSGHPPLATG